MTDIIDKIGLSYPILQTGMGGGMSNSELAGAVSHAGGLGTIGILSPHRILRELKKAHDVASNRPVAVNLLLPFSRMAHVEACISGKASVVVLFYGFSRKIVSRLRDAGIIVLHQVGTLEQAKRAVEDGAEAIIAQGIEAGGHLLATQPGKNFLSEVKNALGDTPVFLAGGISGPEDVRAALDAGASGVVCGTRFLLTEECRAHPGYKERVLGAARTIVTELFGLGWLARHRVVPNAATHRWCRRNEMGPWLARMMYGMTGWTAKVMPMDQVELIHKIQSIHLPLYSPASPLVGEDERTLDIAPLYAGMGSRSIHSIVPAEQALCDLAKGCS